MKRFANWLTSSSATSSSSSSSSSPSSRSRASTAANQPAAASSNASNVPVARVRALPPGCQRILANVRSQAVRRAFCDVDEDEHTAKSTLRVVVCSWNVCGSAPPSVDSAEADLAPWLAAMPDPSDPNAQYDDDAAPTLVAMCLQEMVSLSASNVVQGSLGYDVDGGAKAAADWDSLAALTLHQRYGVPYTRIAKRQLVGTYLSVWAIATDVSEGKVGAFGTDAVATGTLGVLGNKGGCLASVRVHETTVAFISAHLSSGEDIGSEKRRNDDASSILRRGTFDGAAVLAAPPTEAALIIRAKMLAAAAAAASTSGDANEAASKAKVPTLSVEDHDICFFVGDLNYRLHDMPVKQTDVRGAVTYVKDSLMDTGSPAALLNAHDELTAEMAAGRVFPGFREEPITFPPTFKFKKGTDRYTGEPEDDADVSASNATDLEEDVAIVSKKDAQPEEDSKPRKPAWTDRCLLRVRKTATSVMPTSLAHISCRSYGSADLRLSDHRPVHLHARLTCRYARMELPSSPGTSPAKGSASPPAPVPIPPAVACLRRAFRDVDMASATKTIPRCRVAYRDSQATEASAVGVSFPGKARYGSIARAPPLDEPLGAQSTNVESGIFATLCNEGGCPALWGFRVTPDDAAGHAELPRWLSVTPREGLLLPEEEKELSFCARIGPGDARRAPGEVWCKPGAAGVAVDGGAELSTVLVLGCEMGGDSFVPITVKYAGHPYGCDLDCLRQYEGPSAVTENGDDEQVATLSAVGSAADLPSTPEPELAQEIDNDKDNDDGDAPTEQDPEAAADSAVERVLTSILADMDSDEVRVNLKVEPASASTTTPGVPARIRTQVPSTDPHESYKLCRRVLPGYDRAAGPIQWLCHALVHARNRDKPDASVVLSPLVRLARDGGIPLPAAQANSDASSPSTPLSALLSEEDRLAVRTTSGTFVASGDLTGSLAALAAEFSGAMDAGGGAVPSEFAPGPFDWLRDAGALALSALASGTSVMEANLPADVVSAALVAFFSDLPTPAIDPSGDESDDRRRAIAGSVSSACVAAAFGALLVTAGGDEESIREGSWLSPSESASSSDSTPDRTTSSLRAAAAHAFFLSCSHTQPLTTKAASERLAGICRSVSERA